MFLFFISCLVFISLASSYNSKQNFILTSGGDQSFGGGRHALRSTMQKKYLSWGLDLQQEYNEADLLNTLGSSSFSNIPLAREYENMLRCTGRLSITYNLDILRDNLFEAVRRNRGGKLVSPTKCSSSYSFFDQNESS